MPAPKYPWPDWFARGRFQLRRGAEFDCELTSMEQQVRNKAQLHAPGKRVRVHYAGGGVLEVKIVDRDSDVDQPRGKRRAKAVA